MKSYSARKPMALVFAFLAVWAFASVATAEEKAKALIKVGDAAPDFAFPKEGATEPSGATKPTSEMMKLSELKGKKNVVLAFYPKAFTSGCTTQLCGYRDNIAKFQGTDTEVVAVSLDPQSDSDKFRTENHMPFPVLGDSKGEVAAAYGIPLLDKNGVKLAQRSVVVVDKKGVVRFVKSPYDIEKDKDALYDELKALN